MTLSVKAAIYIADALEDHPQITKIVIEFDAAAKWDARIKYHSRDEMLVGVRKGSIVARQILAAIDALEKMFDLS